MFIYQIISAKYIGKKQSFIIAGETFNTKSSLQKRIQSILYKYSESEYLSPDDFQFIFEILKLHPDSDIKVGVGVKAIYIKQNPIYKSNRGFWIVRADSTETDFSYLECLKETSHEKRFKNACRVALEPHMMSLKREFFDKQKGGVSICPFSQDRISFTTCHVDHKAPMTFNKIVELFVSEFKIDIGSIKINGKGEDRVVQDTFDDKELEHKWIEYHNNVAQLQIVSPKANLSLLKTSTPQLATKKEQLSLF